MAKKKKKKPPIWIPGFTPDWNALIQQNPGYQSFLSGIGAQETGQIASLGAAGSSSLINLGYMPELSGVLGQLIPGQTGGLAGGNPNSTMAHLGLQNEQALGQIDDTLAGRGLFKSGDREVQRTQQNQAFEKSKYDAIQQVLDFLNSLANEYQQGESERFFATQDAIGTAQQEEMMDPANEPTERHRANIIPGIGYYQDAGGTLYYANGTKLEPVSARKRLGAWIRAQRAAGVPEAKIRQHRYFKRYRFLGQYV